MEHDGHRERLRERFYKDELDSFAPHEALELLLTFAIPRVNVNSQAHQLIEYFGSLHAVLDASVEDLMKVKGIGRQAATLIHMLVPMGRMYDQSKLAKKTLLANTQALEDYCRTLYRGVHVERFYVLCLDTRLQLIACVCVGEGTQTEVQVYARKVLEQLIKHNATGAVLLHNHPSGTVAPSNEDIAITESLQSLLTGIEIRLYDHLLIAQDNVYSFSRNHLLDSPLPLTSAPSLSLVASRDDRLLPARSSKKQK